jgi:ABC-2 type transport system permease protein
VNTLTRKLIAREFRMHRWLIGGSIVAGLMSLAVMTRGGHMNFNIGFVIWLTTIVAFGAVIAMFGIATERKERVRNWVLSLPISHGDYVRIKALALVLCYFVPWFVLSAGAVGLVVAWPHLPDGLLPCLVLLCAFMFANYALVLCSALHLHSEGPMTLVIIVHNIGITLFIFLIVAIDDIARHMQGPVAVWNSAFWIVLAVELAIFLVLLTLPWLVAARRRDFI